MTDTTDVTTDEVDDEIYKQRWSVCDSCGCGITVTNEDGVPDPHNIDTEWECSYRCPVCGESLADQFGNADPDTEDDQWRARMSRLRQSLWDIATEMPEEHRERLYEVLGRPPGADGPDRLVLATDDIKRMNITEFRELGFLQEVNRQFLHPLGLALETVVYPSGYERLGGIWDYRDDAVGMIFGGGEIDHDKIHHVEDAREAKFAARDKLFSSSAVATTVQPEHWAPVQFEQFEQVTIVDNLNDGLGERRVPCRIKDLNSSRALEVVREKDQYSIEYDFELIDGVATALSVALARGLEMQRADGTPV